MIKTESANQTVRQTFCAEGICRNLTKRSFQFYWSERFRKDTTMKNAGDALCSQRGARSVCLRNVNYTKPKEIRRLVVYAGLFGAL